MRGVVSLPIADGEMIPNAPSEDGGVDRRTFLKAAPRHVLDGVRVLLTDLKGLASSVPALQDRPATRRIAILDVSRCLAWGAGSCQLCYLQCPLRDRAIILEGDKPTIVSSVCDGCGICAEVCRSVNDLGAIRLVDALPLHT